MKKYIYVSCQFGDNNNCVAFSDHVHGYESNWKLRYGYLVLVHDEINYIEWYCGRGMKTRITEVTLHWTDS